MSWDVRTNMKAKPGSQGTLFQGGSDQMTDAKWPKHYTPERLHEVRQVVAGRQRSFPDRPSMGELDQHPDTRKLIDNIARSTVPLQHLQHLQFAPNKSDEEMTSGKGDAQLLADGIHSPSVMGPSGLGLIRLRRGKADSPVAIHEIGHDVSHRAGRPVLNTRTKLGHEEATADAYAQEHFRDRRGRSTSFDGYRYLRPDSLRNDEFFASYHATRPREIEFSSREPDPHLPGLDAVTVFKAGRKKAT